LKKDVYLLQRRNGSLERKRKGVKRGNGHNGYSCKVKVRKPEKSRHNDLPERRGDKRLIGTRGKLLKRKSRGLKTQGRKSLIGGDQWWAKRKPILPVLKGGICLGRES